MIDNSIVISVMCAKQFFHDQTRCACTSHSKFNKRIVRANYVAKNSPAEFGYISIFDRLILQFVSVLRKLIKIDVDSTDSWSMIKYLEKSKCKTPQKNDVIVFDLPSNIIGVSGCNQPSHNYLYLGFKLTTTKPIILSDHIKKSVESILTSNLANLDGIYSLTCNFFKKIIKTIFSNNDKIDKIDKIDKFHNLSYSTDTNLIINHIRNNDIIFELKGGMASKMLMKIITIDPHKNIDKVFSNGDNDTTILINPALPNFDQIHNIICTRMHTAMKMLSDKFFAKLGRYVKQIEMFGLKIADRKFNLCHTKVCGFRGTNCVDKHVLVYDEARNIKVQRNELRIFDQVGCYHHFELLRLKLPFKCLERTICGELLDISVPYKDECVLKHAFDSRMQMIPVDWVKI